MPRQRERATTRAWRYGEIERDDIANAALRLAERVGVAGFTMRLLAKELGVSSMTSYYHFSNKQEVLDVAFEKLLSRVEIPPGSSRQWRSRLTEHYRSTRRELLRVPGCCRILLERPLTAQAKRLGDAVIELLLAAGFDEPEALDICATLTAFTLGDVARHHAILEHERRLPTVDRDGTPIAMVHVLESAREEADRRFEFGLESILTGVTHHRSKRRASAHARKVRTTPSG